VKGPESAVPYRATINPVLHSKTNATGAQRTAGAKSIQ
jgi:hypothetical protein